jgi:hypothetical protein
VNTATIEQPGGESNPLSLGIISDYARSHPKQDGETIGRALTRRMTRAQLAAHAVDDVAAIVDALRRHWARDAEDRAAVMHPSPRLTPVRKPAPGWVEGIDFQELYDNPAGYRGNKKARAAFRRWCGDERFADWYARAYAIAEQQGEAEAEYLESDFYDGGVQAYYAERRYARIIELVKHVADETRLTTTRELLATVFAIGDGTETTWGAATIEQHRQRIAMLTANAAGVVETAARHEAAVRMIEQAGVTCLADLADASEEGAA